MAGLFGVELESKQFLHDLHVLENHLRECQSALIVIRDRLNQHEAGQKRLQPTSILRYRALLQTYQALEEQYTQNLTALREALSASAVSAVFLH